MPATYEHTDKATGDALTANVYNLAHRNHINNGSASRLGGHSGDVTTMQESLDPGTALSPVLTDFISEDIEQVRYVLARIKDTTHWYDPTTYTHNHALTLRQGTNPSGVVLAPCLNPFAVSDVQTLWVCPRNYASGDLTFTVVSGPVLGQGGDVRIVLSLESFSGGSVTDVEVVTYPASPDVVTTTFDLAAASVQALAGWGTGTVYNIKFARDPAHVDDTSNDYVLIVSVTISYAAKPGVKR